MMSRRNALLCLVLICGAFCLLLLGDKYIHTELTFSRASGFYAEPFELELSAPIGTKIYYTLDGSDPDENAELYVKPLTIDDATAHPNVYSLRTDVSPEYFSDSPVNYTPNHLIDKCTVVRAVYQDADGNLSEVKTQSYFVGFEAKPGYQNLNVISIVTDPDNLFDPDKGIYVWGRECDSYFEESPDLPWPSGIENYCQHGFAWERPADIQMFNTDREGVLEQSCGIRIQGGGSRTRYPKSLNLYARGNYSRAKRFYIDLFETGYMADTLTLSASGQDTVTKFRDMFVAALSVDRDFCTPNYIPFAMFLNGEYWGVYWITERYTDVYFEHYYDIDANNVIIYKSGSLAEGVEEDMSLYSGMMRYLNDIDMSVPENYESAGYVIDLQSYIDYYATEIYIGRNLDWPGTNEAIWRVRQTSDDNEYEDGRWRWILFDVNSSSLATSLIEDDTLAWVMERSDLFCNLAQSNEFRRQFTTTVMDLANTSFSPEYTESVISDYMDFMAEPIDIHLARFYGEDSEDRFDEAMADIRNFLEHRKEYIAKYLKEHFGLTGTLAPVKIEISDTEAGSVVLNTAAPSFDEYGKWCGEYYTDYPIALSAAANEGWHFVGWETGAVQEEMTAESAIELAVPESGLSIRAVFEKDGR